MPWHSYHYRENNAPFKKKKVPQSKTIPIRTAGFPQTAVPSGERICYTDMGLVFSVADARKRLEKRR